ATALSGATPGDYTLTWTISNAPCTASTASLTLTVGCPTASVGGAQAVCIGGTTSSLGGNTPSTGTGTWSVTTFPTGGHTSDISFSSLHSGSSTATALSGAVSGSYTLTWTITSGCATVSAGLTLMVGAQPSIGTQPGLIQLCPGGNGNLTVSVNGGVNPVYQWYYLDPSNSNNPVSVTDGTPTGISYGGSQNSGSLSVTAGSTPTTGQLQYQCVITYSDPGCPASLTTTSNSSNGMAVVGNQPHVVSGPFDISNLCTGDADNLTVAATSGGLVLSYEWQYNNGGSWQPVANNTPSGITYSGTTSNSLDINTASGTSAGNYQYRCVVDATGNNCQADNSSAVTAYVNKSPAVSPGSNSPICASTGTALTINANATAGSSSTLNYVWTGTMAFTPGNVATATVSSPTSDMSGTYDVVVTDGNGCTAEGSTSVSIGSLGVTATVSGCMLVDSAHFNAPAVIDSNLIIVEATNAVGTINFVYPAGTKLSGVHSSTIREYEAPANAGSYVFTVSDATGCTASATINTANGNPLNVPYTSAAGSEQASCYDDQGFDKWITFTDASNNAIASVHDANQALGKLQVSVYKDASVPQIPQTGTFSSCSSNSTALARHYVISSDATQPFAAPVQVRLYFTDDELNDLIYESQANDVYSPQYMPCTYVDDVHSINDLYVTKYDDGVNSDRHTEDGDYTNNLDANSGGIYRVYGDPQTGNNYISAPTGPLTKHPGEFRNIFPNGNTQLHYVQLSMTEFSELWLGGSNGNAAPLPVSMLYLEAEAMNNTYIQLRWATATEINNNRFNIERSTDGQNWTTIDSVPGHNNSTSELDYSYNDLNVVAGTRYYYRLKQVDNNGQFSYTDMVTAMIYGDAEFSIKGFIPNPTTGSTYLLINASMSQTVSVDVYDMVGQKIMSGDHELTPGANKLNYDFSQLAAGTYTAVITSANQTYTKKVVVGK
ncbi:MAG TPA: T9SS type A sorting domain-containing protein, partial [Chitinophagales bacterium]|nr:T9SS type A sorting domain-containing protein [Chitinophagales bacterium]